MVMLAALTGLRVGELLALRWKMIDLTGGTIRICESVFHGQVQAPKSERSIRTIPIGPQTRLLLEEHRKRFAASPSSSLARRIGRILTENLGEVVSLQLRSSRNAV
jgi:integrase